MALDKKKGAFPVLSIIGQPVYTNMKEKEQESCNRHFHALSLQCQKDKTFPQTNNKIINLKYMKAKSFLKNAKMLATALVCLMVSNSCLADDKPIPVEKLPAAAKTFVQNNFQGKTILFAAKDWNTYECHLNDGTQIDFRKDGTWDKVDCNMAAVPVAIIPETIQNYVKANFPDTFITKIDKERHGYDVELSNNLELKFNQQGVLIGMDD